MNINPKELDAFNDAVDRMIDDIEAGRVTANPLKTVAGTVAGITGADVRKVEDTATELGEDAMTYPATPEESFVTPETTNEPETENVEAETETVFVAGKAETEVPTPSEAVPVRPMTLAEVSDMPGGMLLYPDEFNFAPQHPDGECAVEENHVYFVSKYVLEDTAAHKIYKQLAIKGNTKETAYVGQDASRINPKMMVVLENADKTVQAYFGSAAAAAELLGFNPTTIRTWATQDRTHGTGGTTLNYCEL